jgi:hypothetical protein
MAGRHHQEALARGVINDNTEAMNCYILDGVRADLPRAQAVTPTPAQAMPPAQPALHRAMTARPSGPPACSGPPVSAPVSREVPGSSFTRLGEVTLSLPEREAARITSISDVEYAIRLGLQKMLGRYLEPR